MTTHQGSTSNYYSLNSNFSVNVFPILSFFKLNRISTRWFNDVRTRFLTIAATAVIAITTTGCQLLIDNRKTGKTSVVVVPTDEWDALRGQQMQPGIASEIAKEMAAGIADELRAMQSAIAATTPGDGARGEETIKPTQQPSPTPIEGSQNIQ